MITLKIVVTNFLPRCTTFFNNLPMESLEICNSNAVQLGKKFLAAIFSAILYSTEVNFPTSSATVVWILDCPLGES